MPEIQEISKYDNNIETVDAPDGYYITQVPAATPGNILALMEKINELVAAVNQLQLQHLPGEPE